MRHQPVRLATCIRSRDLLNGTDFLTIGITSVRGKTVEKCYTLQRGEEPGTWDLVHEDGEVVTVKPGGRCSCDDQKFRGRECKHVLATRLAGLFGKAMAVEEAGRCRN